MRTIAIALLVTACSAEDPGAVGLDPDETSDDGKADGAAHIPDVHCSGRPDANRPTEDFDHWTSHVVVNTGDPKHRGFDLVTSSTATEQSLSGWISYGLIDKALEDEVVEVFACRAGKWRDLGRTRTDDEGRFEMILEGSKRVPVGIRDLYVSVVGDRSGVGFLAFVAPPTTKLIVSDVDGTLTSSEGAFFETLALGIEPDAHEGAAAAYRAAKAKGYQLVYVTARGNQNTELTRAWLDHQGFPRGPVRLAPHFITLPGEDTVEYKTETMQALGVEISAGVGNRASDITAYEAAGAERIYIETPEFESEVKPEIDAGRATGFETYVGLDL